MMIVGVDPSLSGTGVAVLVDGVVSDAVLIRSMTWLGTTPKRTPRTEYQRQERVDEILAQLRDWTSHADMVVLEDIAVTSHDTRRQLAGLSHVIRRQLWKAGTEYALVPPSSLKQWATGKGRASKEEMVAAAQGAFPGVELATHDVADALLLAAMGARRYGVVPVNIAADHDSALDRVTWPDFEAAA